MKKTILLSLIFALFLLFAVTQVNALAIYEFSCNNTINALGSTVVCKVNVSDYGAQTQPNYFTRANITLPNGTVENQSTVNGTAVSLPNANNTLFNVTFTNTRVLGVYTIRWFVSNVTDTNTTSPTFNVTDTVVPSVFSVAPSNNTQANNNNIFNHSYVINITVNVTDNADAYDGDIGVRLVRANITYINGTVKFVTLVNRSKDIYNGTFQVESNAPLGEYALRIVANDSSNNVNNTGFTTFFNITDITKPSVSELASAPIFAVQGTAITVTATVTDNLNSPENLSRVFLNVSGLPSGGAPQSLINMTNTSATTFTATFTATDEVGTYTYSIVANDTLNNVNNTVGGTFVITAKAVASGGGGGGGGGGFGSQQSSLTRDSISSTQATDVQLRMGSTFNFIVNGQQHKIYLVKRVKDTITITIRSVTQTLTMTKGESKDVDLDGDGKNDVTLTFAELSSTYATLQLKKIEIAAPAPAPVAKPAPAATPTPAPQIPSEQPAVQPEAQQTEQPEAPAQGLSTPMVAVIVVIAVLLAVWYYYKRK